jgi:hypothetical protein
MAIVATASHKSDKIMQAFAKFTVARIEYLDCIAKAGTDEERMRKHSGDVAAAIGSKVACIPKFQPDAAKKFVELIMNSKMLPEHRDLVVKAMDEKVELSAMDVATQWIAESNTKQIHMNFAEYLQENHHESGLLLKSDSLTRIRVLALLARKMGANYMDEDSKARVTACAFHDSEDHHLMALAGDFGYEMLSKFRHFYNQVTLTTPGRDPDIYPSFQNFERQCPALYIAAGYAPGQDKPLFSKQLAIKLTAIGNQIPKRRTNQNVCVADAASFNQRNPRFALQRSMSDASGLESLPGFLWSPPGWKGHPHPRSPYLPLQDGKGPPPLQEQPKAQTEQQPPPQGQPKQQTEQQPPQEQPKQTEQQPPQEQPKQQMGQQPDAQQPKKSVSDMIAAMQENRQCTKAYKKPAAAAAAKPKAKAKTKTKTKAKAKTKTKAKASNPIAVKPRSIHNEASIKSILARSGKDTFPRTKSFKYGSHATMNKARRDAEKWLQEMGA